MPSVKEGFIKYLMGKGLTRDHAEEIMGHAQFRRYLNSPANPQVQRPKEPTVILKSVKTFPDMVKPIGGNQLSIEDAEMALRRALRIIEAVGTTKIEYKFEESQKWVSDYFPSYKQ